MNVHQAARPTACVRACVHAACRPPQAATARLLARPTYGHHRCALRALPCAGGGNMLALRERHPHGCACRARRHPHWGGEAAKGGLAACDTTVHVQLLCFANSPRDELPQPSNTRMNACFLLHLLQPWFLPLGGERKPGEGVGFVEWLYLDQNLRVTRGNKGSLFVHTREA